MQLRPTGWQRLFTTACGSLSKFPYLDLGRNGRIPGSRELVFSGLPYVVVYHLQGEVVELLRIYHGAQDWP